MTPRDYISGRVDNEALKIIEDIADTSGDMADGVWGYFAFLIQDDHPETGEILDQYDLSYEIKLVMERLETISGQTLIAAFN